MGNGFEPCMVSHAQKDLKRTVCPHASNSPVRSLGPEGLLDAFCSSSKPRMNA
jgi:hypothetical protein